MIDEFFKNRYRTIIYLVFKFLLPVVSNTEVRCFVGWADAIVVKDETAYDFGDQVGRCELRSQKTLYRWNQKVG